MSTEITLGNRECSPLAAPYKERQRAASSEQGRQARISNGASASPAPRLALSPAEAAAAVGVSRDFFDQHILPELRVVRRGRRRLISVRELERWLDQNATTTLRDEQR